MNDERNDERTAVTDRQTSLAVERTQLAWWRTGLTALAVAVGLGRVVPELSDSGTTWPYAAVGIAFAIYGTALFFEGTARGRSVASLNLSGRRRPSLIEPALVVAGPLLGAVVIVMIVLAG